MAHFDNRYSQFIAWFKILLPVAALALLSTMFLFSGKSAPSNSIPYSEVDIESVVREQRMAAPLFAGVSEDGRSFVISAAQAQPDDSNADVIVASTVESSVQSPAGDTIDIKVGQARINGKNQTAVFSNGASVNTSTGYEITTPEIYANFETNRMETSDSVMANGPLGQLTAGKLVIESTAGGKDLRLLFTDGVKIVYSPANGTE